MKSGRTLRIFLVGILLAAATRAEAPRSEAGWPFLSCYSSKEYGAASQNWVFAEDDRGVLYVGNSLGVLEYDGASWRLIETATKGVVRALAKDEHGRMYVGTTADFGYLTSDASGQTHYLSLMEHVKPDERAFNDIWTAYVTPQGIYFQARERLFRVTPPEASQTGGQWLVQSWKPQGRFLYAMWVGGTYYVHQEGVGLMRMVGDDLQLIPGSQQFAQERLHVFLPFAGDAGQSPEILVGTFNRGLFLYDGQTFRPFPTDADDYLRNQTLYKGALLPDGTFGLTTIGGGAVIMDRHGHALRYLNQTTGLPSNNTLAILVDRGGIVWLGLEGYVCEVETPSPLSRFDLKTGLLGGVSDIVRHKGVIYAGTSVGAFYLDPSSSLFKPVTGFAPGNPQVQGMLSTGDDLLVAYGSGLHQIEGTRASLIKPNVGASYVSNALRTSLQDNRRVWVGLDNGLGAFRLDASGRWIDEGHIEGIHENVGSIVESEAGVLWLGSGGQGARRVRFNGTSLQHPQIERFGKAQGLPSDAGVAVFQAAGHVVFVMAQGVFRFDEAAGRFVPDTTWKDVSFGGTQGEASIMEDQRGDVWVNLGLETAVFRRQSDGTYRADKTALLRFSDLAVSKILAEPGGVVWFGRDDGLVRYDPSIVKNYAVDYSALIRRVTVGDDRPLFRGAVVGDSQAAAPRMASGDNALRFEFAATSYDDARATQYQSMLDGFDPHWSSWTTESKRDYTNLPPGAYRFRVHARNIYQHQSAEAVYGFTILPPWYRTWWAYLLYVAGALSAIFGLVRVRTEQLRKESRRLEGVVTERTQEIREREAQVRTQAEELQTLDDIVKAINREVGLRNVLHALLEEGRKLFPQAEKGGFLIRDLKRDAFVFGAQSGYEASELKGIELTEDDIRQRYAEGTERIEQGVYIVRPAGDRAASDKLRRLPPVKAMLAMTVSLHGQLEGILVFDNLTDANAFNHSDLQRLSRLREHAVAAIVKARTLLSVQEKTVELQQQKEQIEQAKENVDLLSRIGRDITAKLSIQQIIDTVYENVNALMDAAVFGIGLYNEPEQRIDFPATKESGQTLAPYSNRLDDESRLAVWCFKQQQEIVVDDLSREYARYVKEYKPPLAGNNPASVLYLPLAYKEKPIGVITAQSFRKRAYNEYHLNILRNLATYTTIALENADAYRQLNSTLDRLKAMQEQLVTQEKLASLGALTAGIAHEIKNPLNFVNNFAELSVEMADELQGELVKHRAVLDSATFENLQALTGDLAGNARKINEHGKRADSIVRGMLLHSRGQTGDRQDTDINSLLDEYVNLSYHGMRAQDSSFNVTIDKAYDESIGRVGVVPQDLSRVFLNILNNACYAANEKKRLLEKGGNGAGYSPTLAVRTRNLGDTVEIRIRDNGNGIPSEVRDKIFNPFFTTKPTGQGTGLGLSISHDIIVQEHNGVLDVETEPGQFTEFIIRLPKGARA